MKKNQQYSDWRKELQIWESINTVLNVNRKIQAGMLFQSLEGIYRQTVLSELSVSEITAENGVKSIIKTLDELFTGNVKEKAYVTFDELMQYKYEEGLSMQHFLVNFQLKANKVKASGTILSDDVLGYLLLNAAKLPESKHLLIKQQQHVKI